MRAKAKLFSSGCSVQSKEGAVRTFVVCVLVSVTAAVLSGSAAGAGPPAIATGTYNCSAAAVTVLSSRTADGNTIGTYTAAGCVYSGDITGTFTIYGNRVTHSDGSFNDHGYIVCTGCTLDGRTGEFTAAQTYRSPSPGEVYGTLTVVSASGGLSGLHAQNHFERHAPALGTYSFRYSFEP